MTVMAPAQEDTKALAAQLRANLGITGPRSKLPMKNVTAPQLLGSFYYHGHGDETAQRVANALHGIEYAVSTGRLSGTTILYMRNLSPWSWCTLVAQIATGCRTTSEVWHYLNDHLAARAMAWFTEWSDRD